MAPSTDADVGDQRSEGGFPAVVLVAEGQRERRLIASLLASERIEAVTAAVVPDRINNGATGGSSSAESEPPLIILCCEIAAAADQVAAARRSFPVARLVLVAPQDETGRTLRAALRAQVQAMVYAEHVEEALGPTVRAVLAEQVVFPSTERRRVEMPTLSHREKQVLRHAVQGLTNAEIATRLCLATSTVKSHLTSSFRKLAVSSRSEAAAVLLDPDEPAGRMILVSPGEFEQSS